MYGNGRDNVTALQSTSDGVRGKSQTYESTLSGRSVSLGVVLGVFLVPACVLLCVWTEAGIQLEI